MSAFLNNMYGKIVTLAMEAQTRVDFYNQNTGEDGGTIWPFVGFMCSLFGLVFLAIGVVRYVSAKNRFNMFFDQRDQIEAPSEEKYKKEMFQGKIMAIIGAVLTVVSFVLL